MKIIVSTASGNANIGGAGSCTETCTTMQTVFAVMRAARGLWGRKVVVFLQQITGRSERTVRYWNAGQRDLSAEEIAALLRSEDGLAFLSAVMANATPRWWKAFKAQVAAQDARRMQRAAVRRLQEALDADVDLTAALSRAEALPDQDFMRPHADAMRAVARVPHRAVAPTASKRRDR